jgi:hypothetical protein
MSYGCKEARRSRVPRRRYAVLIALLVGSSCGGGGSSDSGSVNFGAVWQQPGTATPAPGTPRATPGGGTRDTGAFGTTLPPSVNTVRIVFDSPKLRCCIAIQPSTIPPDPQTGRREIVLEPLPTGPATIGIFGYPSLTAPAPAGGPVSICPTQPSGVGAPCPTGGTDTPSFASDPTPLTIEPGAVADVGQVPVRSVPFVIASSRLPAPESAAPSPSEISFVVADAISGVDPSSVRAQITDALGMVSGASLDLSPCDDGGSAPCSPGGGLEVKGLRATAAARDFPVGNTTVRVLARNLATPAESVDTQWRFHAESPLPLPSATRTPTATATLVPTGTATLRSTATPTRTTTSTSAPSSTPTPSVRPSPTSTLTPRPTPTPTAKPTATDTRLPSLTPTRSSTPTPTRTPMLTQTMAPTLPPCADDAPQNPCAPGTGVSRRACEFEWLFSPPPQLGSGAIPLRSISCHDGDPTCDIDGKADQQCTFRLFLCINNTDPRLSRCSPSQLDSFEVRAPNPNSPRDAADSHNTSVLEGAAGSSGFGVTVLRAGNVLFTGVPNDTLNLCSDPLDILVPLGSTGSAGVRRLKVNTSNANQGTVMSMRMSCLPAAALAAPIAAAEGTGGEAR